MTVEPLKGSELVSESRGSDLCSPAPYTLDSPLESSSHKFPYKFLLRRMHTGKCSVLSGANRHKLRSGQEGWKRSGRAVKQAQVTSSPPFPFLSWVLGSSLYWGEFGENRMCKVLQILSFTFSFK